MKTKGKIHLYLEYLYKDPQKKKKPDNGDCL